jgi:hypothetical protein
VGNSVLVARNGPFERMAGDEGIFHGLDSVGDILHR